MEKKPPVYVVLIALLEYRREWDLPVGVELIPVLSKFKIFVGFFTDRFSYDFWQDLI